MKFKRRKLGWLLAGLLALLLVVFLVYRMTRPAEAVVVDVKAQTVELALSVVGRARAGDMVQVASPNGGQVIELLADDGDVVAAGDVLAVVRANVEQAQTQADVAREAAARAEVEEARLNFNRTKALHDRGFAADAALESARAALQTKQANLAAATAQVRASSEKAREFVIRAPVSGTILYRPIDKGQVVTAAETLFEMGSNGGTEIQAEVEEAYADVLNAGQKGRAALSGSEEVFAIRLAEVSPRVNPATGGRLVKLVRDDGQSLPPGRSIDVTLVVQERPQTISIPRRAIVDATASPKVMVVDAGNVVKARAVTVLRWPTTNAIVTEGLKAGDRIVLEPEGLEDGQKIRPVSEGR